MWELNVSFAIPNVCFILYVQHCHCVCVCVRVSLWCLVVTTVCGGRGARASVLRSLSRCSLLMSVSNLSSYAAKSQKSSMYGITGAHWVKLGNLYHGKGIHLCHAKWSVARLKSVPGPDCGQFNEMKPGKMPVIAKGPPKY